MTGDPLLFKKQEIYRDDYFGKQEKQTHDTNFIVQMHLVLQFVLTCCNSRFTLVHVTCLVLILIGNH